VEREVPQTNEGTRKAPTQDNVIRLGDWIGPREELVPFGRRAGSREVESGGVAADPEGADSPAARSAGLASFVPEAPPSAEDFWGERSAAVHDALQAPADDRAPEPQGGTGNAPARRLGFIPAPRRRVAGAAALATVAAALALAGLVIGGSTGTSAGRQKLNVAAVLSRGVSSIFKLPSPHIGVAAGADHARARPRVTRHAPRAGLPSKSAHQAGRQHHSTSVSAPPPHSSYSPPLTSSFSASTYHPSVSGSSGASGAASSPITGTSSSEASRSSPPPSAPRPSSSGATVSPTGESGALGPVQSPNG
jgi:hypothetical protein